MGFGLFVLVFFLSFSRNDARMFQLIGSEICRGNAFQEKQCVSVWVLHANATSSYSSERKRREKRENDSQKRW